MNEFFSKYKPTIETIGIAGGLVLLFLTYKNIHISTRIAENSSRSLEILLNRYLLDSVQTTLEKKKILPNWKYEILDSSSFAIYLETDNGYIINHVRKFHANKTGLNGNNQIVPEENIGKISISHIINYLTNVYKRKRDFDPSVINSHRTSYPLGMRFDYSHSQERFQDHGIIYLRFAIDWNEKPSFKLIGIEPSNYFSQLIEGDYSYEKMLNSLEAQPIFKTIY